MESSEKQTWVQGMVGRSEEICDMAGRRNLDVCCLQETRWKHGNAKMIGREGLVWRSGILGNIKLMLV